MTASSSVCGDCAVTKGRACCEVGEGEKLATLTAADIERIEQATGLPEHRFVEREALDPLAAQSFEEARPLYKRLFATGLRLGLKAKGGACVFLERGVGCTLAEEVKPIACRLYPFDFDAAGTLTVVDAPHCLALERSEGKQHLLTMFGATEEKLAALREQARAEVAGHHAASRRRGGFTKR